MLEVEPVSPRAARSEQCIPHARSAERNTPGAVGRASGGFRGVRTRHSPGTFGRPRVGVDVTTTAMAATPLIGRQEEVAAVRGTLTAARLVTLTGIGGAGKTRVARQLACELAADVTVWFVELADVLDPELLGHAVAQRVGLQPTSDTPESMQVAAYVGDRSAVLVLDNCEHLAAACADLVEELLAACPGLMVLATSRQALGLAEEHVHPVPPLRVPDAEEPAALDGAEAWRRIADVEAVRLFVQRASAVMPDFALTPRNAEAVGRLCAALEGVPLAIELAAARIRVLTPQAMLDRLTDRYGLLSRGFRGAPLRQQSLAASVGWSYDLCTEQERLLWARLSVFTGGFGLEAAETVCSGAGIEPGDVLDLLASLLDRSLLTRDPDEVDVHYRMLETIRQYGADRLELAGETEQWQVRHRAWFLGLAERCGEAWHGPDQVAWVRRMQRNHPNLRAAFEAASALPEEAPRVLGACVALETYWVATRLLSEARRWTRRSLEHRTGTDDQRAVGLALAAYLASVQMDLDEAALLLEEEARLAAASGDLAVRGYDHLAHAMQTLFAGDVTGAIPRCLQAVELFAQAGRPRPEGTARATLGVMYFYAGELDRCRDFLQELLGWLPEGELYFAGFAYWILASAALMGGDTPRALTMVREGARVNAALSNQLGLAWTFETAAAVAGAEGSAEHSATLLGAAQSIWRRVGESSLSAPYISAQRELGEQIARGTLPDRGFEAAYRRGLALSQDEAVAFALGEGRPRPVSDSPLTAREEQVAGLLGEGASNQEIADRLVISVRTAQGHVENILRKLGFSSRAQVAAWVVRREGVPPASLRAVR